MLSFSRCAALAAAVVTGVTAYNEAPPVPQNAQIGALNFDVTCALFGALNYTFNTFFTATAAVSYGSGQDIYYTDVVGTITIPADIINLAPLIAAKHATADADIQLRLTNAEPATFTAFKDTITNISIPNSGDAYIRIPQGNGTLPPIGPITLGEENVAHRILIGDISITVTLQGEDYSSLLTVPVTCGRQSVDYVLGSINVDDSTGPPYAPANGFVPEFPPTPRLYESGSFRFPYACDFGTLGPQTVDLIISGTIPIYFNPGQPFNLNASQAFLYAPEGLISLAKESYPTATDLTLDVSEFEIKWENASPASYNVVGSAGISTTVNIEAAGGANFSVPIPNQGYLTVGPFTAGDDGTFAAIAIGHSVFKAALKDSSGKVLFGFDGTCDPAAPLELIAVPITTATVDEYVFGIQTANTASAAPGTEASSTSSAGLSLPSLFRA